MDKTAFAELVRQGQALAEMYNVFKPTFPDMLEAFNEVMTETQPLRQSVVDLLKSISITSEELSAESIIAYYKKLQSSGMEEGLIHVLTFERAKTNNASAKAIADAFSKAPPSS